MQSLLCNLTASLLLIQAVTGWCWHAPDGCAKCHDCSTHAFTSTSCCQDRHCKPSEQHEIPLDPCDGQSECQGLCTYVALHETRLDTAQLALSCDFAPIFLVGANHQLTLAVAWERACHLVASEPPLRLHLLHQILVV